MYSKYIDKIPKQIKKLLLIIIDVCIIAFSYLVSHIFIESQIDIFSNIFRNECILAIITYLLFFNILNTYKSVTHYSSIREYFIIFLNSLFSLITILAIKGIMALDIFNYKIDILSSILISVLCICARVAIRLILEYICNFKKTKKEKILIIGAGEAAFQVINNIKHHMRGDYEIVGMIDDSKNKQNTMIYGVEVLGKRGDIVHIVTSKKIDLILFTIQNISENDKNNILNICSKTTANIKIMLPMESIILGKSLSETFRDIQVEDLLGREPINFDCEGISNYINSKTVLITGAGGSIGSELCRQVAKYNPKLIVMLDIYENTLYEVELELNRKNKNINVCSVVASVRDKKRLDEIFFKYKPELVFHAAAHKHVPLMENSPLEAIKNNVFGTYNVVNCADRHNVEKFILISTDKAVNPTNIMGATKRICEMIIQTKSQNSKTKYAAVRFGNVLGSHGSVIPIFKKQIEEGGPITITDKEITRYFMLIPEAVQLILQAMTYAKNGEIFVLDMGKPVKIYDLAQTMVKLSGKNIPINVTGLRPGEKLYEELLIAEEGLSRTLHDKIMVSKIKPITEIQLEKNLEKLRKLLTNENNSKDTIKKIIKEIVPTYIDIEKQGQPNKCKTINSVINEEKKSKLTS